MNTNNDSQLSLEEMVFEHRNKAYGAYVIRRQYSKTMKRAIGTMACVAAFFAGGMAWAMNHQETDISLDTPEIKVVSMDLPKEEPKKKEPAEAVKQPEQAKQPQTPNTPVQAPVVQNQLTDPPIVKDSTSNQPPVNNIAGGAPNGKPGGAGQGPEQPADTSHTIIPPPTGPVEIADVAPDCKGLRPYLMSSLRYPQMPKEEGIQGTVVVSFVVDTNGDVQDIAIAKSVHPQLDKEALRVARGMPKWIPAVTKGRKVSFLFRLPIKFRLD